VAMAHTTGTFTVTNQSHMALRRRLTLWTRWRSESLPPLSPPRSCGKPKRRKGHNLALRLHRHSDEALRFLVDPQVPFAAAFSREVRLVLPARWMDTNSVQRA
jgi:hypothetical protein